MKSVYFACSIRGGRDHQPNYEEIVSLIKAQATVLSEIFADQSQTGWQTELSDSQIWRRDMDWLKAADAVIAEVSSPSLGVGYEIARAELLKKPVLVLYRPHPDRRLSAMISGDPSLEVVEYLDVADLKKPIAHFIKQL